MATIFVFRYVVYFNSLKKEYIRDLVVKDNQLD